MCLFNIYIIWTFMLRNNIKWLYSEKQFQEFYSCVIRFLHIQFLSQVEKCQLLHYIWVSVLQQNHRTAWLFKSHLHSTKQSIIIIKINYEMFEFLLFSKWQFYTTFSFDQKYKCSGDHNSALDYYTICQK